MKKMVSYLLITVLTMTMMTWTMISASAATDTTKINFTYPENVGTAYVTLDGDVKEIESNHNAGNVPDTWTYTSEDADYISLSFDELTQVQEDCDRVIVFDKDNSVYGSYTGTQLAGKKICVPGDKVTVRIISNKIITATTETTYSVNITEVKPFTVGVMDVDDDTTVATITLMQRYLAGEGKLTAAQIKLGDTDNDGKITVADVTALQRYFAEIVA